MSISLKERVVHTKQVFRELFLANDRPWVLTLSGGKDSSTTTQLALEVYGELFDEGLAKKPVYIVTTDTRVEMPIIEDYVNSLLKRIDDHAKKKGWDVHVHLITPPVTDTFWSKLLGRGYPAPTQGFRWCTDRMKIRPTTLFLTSLINKFESIIVLLGVRSAESTNRAESISKRNLNHHGMSTHDTIPNAYTFSPIADWSNSDVWTYLSQNSAPWGGNEEMMSLYDKGSGEADCNIAIHPGNESCGKTRFGCWVCTVVKKDRSMDGMIRHDEGWMQELSDFREKLLEYREMSSGKRLKRMRNSRPGPGPYSMDTRFELLSDLLNIEKVVKHRMIDDEELVEIQRLWDLDGDIRNSAIKLCQENGRLEHVNISSSAFELSNPDDEDLFSRIYEIEKYRKNIGNRHGIVKEIVTRVTSMHDADYLNSTKKDS